MENPHPTAAIKMAALMLSQAHRIVVLSGAGISKASGIPTYRDEGGLWTSGDNLKFSHVSEYTKNPKAFDEFWAARRTALKDAKPNPAHFALFELQKLKPLLRHVTQNVDGLLQAAGCKAVIELHGNLQLSRCDNCLVKAPKSLFGRCTNCLCRTRPDVVMFGEVLSEEKLTTAQVDTAYCDVFLMVGTSAASYPAADLPVMALRAGAKLIILDTEPPLLAEAADLVVRGQAEVLLPEIMERIRTLQE